VDTKGQTRNRLSFSGELQVVPKRIWWGEICGEEIYSIYGIDFNEVSGGAFYCPQGVLESVSLYKKGYYDNVVI